MIKNTALYFCLMLVIVITVTISFIPRPIFSQTTISASYDTDIDFPNTLTFYLEANNTVDINKVFLQYKVQNITSLNITSMVEKKIDAAPAIETEWTWDMRTSTSLPPGADITYSWIIEDSAGNKIETSWETVEFSDNRYNWNRLQEGNITLYWYRGGAAFSRELMDTAKIALERLHSDTGAQLEQAVDIYIYGSSTELRDAFISPQDWMGGVAFTEFGIVAIGIAPEDLSWGKSAMIHELAHLVTYQMTSNPYNTIPTWLTEGLSMYAEDDIDIVFTESLEKAIKKDELISVQTLSSNFPVNITEAYLSYAESYSVVNFLIVNYGRDKMQQLLNTFKHGSTYDNALKEVYGFDTFGLDNEWRASLGLEPRIHPSLTPQNGDSSTSKPAHNLFGCQTASGDTKYGNITALAIIGIILLPRMSKIIHLKAKRGKK